MTDGIIKGTGNSRYLRGPANAPALWSTHDAFMQAFAAGEVLIDLNGINQLGWDTIGDKLGKETLLKDETAQAAGLTTDAVPDDVLAWLIGQAKGIRSIATGGTGNATGNAASATKLQTARTIQTNLASTGTAGFDGTANVTPGVTGVLPVANGGTGNTSLSSLATSLVPYLSGASIAMGTYTGTSNSGTSLTLSIPFSAKFCIILTLISSTVYAGMLVPPYGMLLTSASVSVSGGTGYYRGEIYSISSVTASTTSLVITGIPKGLLTQQSRTYYYVAFG